MSRYVAIDPCINFIPQLGEKHSVFRALGDSLNIFPVHFITNAYYSIPFSDCKGSFTCAAPLCLLQWNKKEVIPW